MDMSTPTATRPEPTSDSSMVPALIVLAVAKVLLVALVLLLGR